MLGRIRRHALLLVLLSLYLALGCAYSIMTPLFEAPDEVWHFANARFVAARAALPVQGSNNGEQAARQEASQPPLYYLLAAPLIGWIDTADFDSLSRLNPHAAPGLPASDGNKNMVTHTPTPFPWQGTVLAVHITRLFSVLLGLITVLSTYALGLRLGHRPPPVATGGEAAGGDARLLALFSAALVAFNPQFVFISASINNDNIMNALGAIVLTLLVYIATAQRREPTSQRVLVLLGVLCGLAALSKLTGLGLLAFAIVTLVVISARRGQPLPSLARDAVLVAGLAALVAGWWYVRNWILYGDVTGLAPMLVWVGQRDLSLQQLAGELQGLELSFWAVLGWFNILVDQGVYTVLQAADRLALAGLVVILLRRTKSGMNLLVLGLCALWAVIAMAGLVRWTATTPGTQGRLLFPAIAGIAALLAAGLAALIPARLRGPVLGTLAALLLALALIAPFRYIAPAYLPPPAIAGAAQIPHPVSIRYGNDEMALLGYDLESTTITPGSVISVTLYMSALKPLSKDYSLFIHIWGRDLLSVGQRDSYPGRGALPTSRMTPGAIIEDRYWVTIAPTATTPSLALLEVGFYDFNSSERLWATGADGARTEMPIVSRLKLVASEAQTQTLQPALFSFGGQANLLRGHVETPPVVEAGSTVTVSTTWQATSAMTQDYTLFLQLVDEQSTIVAQNDGEPQGGQYPTSLWAVGEIVADQRTLTLPKDIAPGRYRLATGMYILTTRERLLVSSSIGDVPQQWAVLGEITLR